MIHRTDVAASMVASLNRQFNFIIERIREAASDGETRVIIQKSEFVTDEINETNYKTFLQLLKDKDFIVKDNRQQLQVIWYFK